MDEFMNDIALSTRQPGMAMNINFSQVFVYFQLFLPRLCDLCHIQAGISWYFLSE